MKHLPNLLTLGNLFSGCIAIAFILNAQPFLAGYHGAEYWVTGVEQAYWGSIFILIAAFFDMLDGLAARALKIFSPIGKDLDSLADIVSFGVAPAMILYKMLWASVMAEPDAMDVSMVATTPAFLIACFGALRLARYNVSTPSANSFTGMPIPAVGLFIASFPLINWLNPEIGLYLQNKYLLYTIIGVLCWLMVSKVRFIKLMPSSFKPAAMWPQLVLIIAAIVGWFTVQALAAPIVFALYIILSFINKPAEQ